jgi:hypothetical protein
LQIIKKKLREEMTTMKNSKILLVSLLIIAIVALAGCSRYDTNPARYDNTPGYGQDGAIRGNIIDNNRVNDGVYDGTRNNNMYDNRLDNNRNNVNNTHHNGLTNGAVNNNR